MAKVKSWCLMDNSQVGIVAVKDRKACVTINVKMIFPLALTNCSGFVTEVDGQPPKILVICIFQKKNIKHNQL